CLPQPVCLVHCSVPVLAAEKALLIKLRKATGYSFVNCKKALDKFSNDIKQAESWLHEQAQMEGWAKASKLQGRRATQGLIGQLLGEHGATMVEVNCETDFVARNETFQQLVREVAAAAMALSHSEAVHSGYNKSLLGPEELSQLKSGVNNTTFANQLALAIGRLGENLTLRRAVVLSVPPDCHVGGYVHGGGPASPGGALLGRYGALVVYRGGGVEEGRKLAQHVVGEAPLSLGSLDELPCGDTETRLVAQSFLSDPSRTVGQYLQDQDVRVLDFVRFECGEGEL
ncbi:EFTS factor, partial [Amia calva]|nr:EFTS factor [Amia calva]